MATCEVQVQPEHQTAPEQRRVKLEHGASEPPFQQVLLLIPADRQGALPNPRNAALHSHEV